MSVDKSARNEMNVNDYERKASKAKGATWI